MWRSALIPLAVIGGLAPLAAAQLSLVDNLPGTYIDISTTGTLIPLGDNDSATLSVPFGNAVFPAGDLIVSNNGGVGYGTLTSTYLDPNNTPLPSTQAFGGGQCALPYWDDIGNTIGGVFYQALTDRYIIQWQLKPIGLGLRGDAGDRSDRIAFQLQIFSNPSGSPAIYAQYLYSIISVPGAGGGASATIGYQNGSAAFNDVLWSYNTPGAVADGDVLSVVIPEPTTALLLLAAALLRRRA
jgi:hypothetical protein